MLTQQRYFDQPNHRFTVAKILHPTLSQRLELNALTRALSLTPPAHIMDFGAGNGRLTIPLLKQGFNVTAMDISRQSLKELTHLYDANKTPSWGTLTTTTQLPPRGRVQGIIGADILHHIDMTTWIPKLYKVLSPQGRVAFSEPNALHIPWYLYIAAARLPWGIEKGILQTNYWNLHRIFFNSGFSDVKIVGHGVLPTVLFHSSNRLSDINRTAGNLPFLKTFAFRLILSAQKNK